MLISVYASLGHIVLGCIHSLLTMPTTHIHLVLGHIHPHSQESGLIHYVDHRNSGINVCLPTMWYPVGVWIDLHLQSLSQFLSPQPPPMTGNKKIHYVDKKFFFFSFQTQAMIVPKNCATDFVKSEPIKIIYEPLK